MRRIVHYLLIPALVALVATGASFFVGEFVVASIPGSQGAGGSADVYGFPLPFATFFPCCALVGNAAAGTSISLDNTYFYHPVNFLLDIIVWITVTLSAALVFTIRRFLLAAAAGLGITLITLLAAPLSSVAPTPALETGVMRPMGFPYDYLTYYSGGFLNFTTSGYDFTLSAFLADYTLWTGIALAIIGVSITLTRARHHQGEATVDRSIGDLKRASPSQAEE